MLSPRIAEQLRAKGQDAVAVAERPDLLQLPDEELLSLASQEARVLVTFDIADFSVLDAQWTSLGRRHHGLVYLASSRFPQDRALIGATVAALDAAATARQLPSAGETRFLIRLD